MSAITIIELQLSNLDTYYRKEKRRLEEQMQSAINSSLTIEKKELAILLHKTLCNGNHGDHCSFNSRDWTNYDSKSYLAIARNILTVTDFNTAKNVILCLKSILK